MAERFPDFQVGEIQELRENSENQNTKKSTSTWLNVWTSWSESKNFENNLLSYEPKQLDETLQKFFAEIRKKDCSEYEPDSLRVMLASLDRHLREKDAPFSSPRISSFPTAEKYLKEKQGFFVKKVSEKGQTLQSHSPLKTKSCCGPKECLEAILHSH